MRDQGLPQYRSRIAARIRALRLERRWTQARFAALLGLSQNRLSEIERGEGSFSAEQLLAVLATFNVPLDYFLPSGASPEPQLQSALARLGAGHLREGGVVPTERLREPAEAVAAALAAALSPRQITALAPVIVRQADALNLGALRLKLAEAGLERRLGWLLDSTLTALGKTGPARSSEGELRRRRAALLLRNALAHWPAGRAGRSYDILDRDIISEETLQQVLAGADPLARKWGVVTRLKTDDFVDALREGAWS